MRLLYLVVVWVLLLLLCMMAHLWQLLNLLMMTLMAGRHCLSNILWGHLWVHLHLRATLGSLCLHLRGRMLLIGYIRWRVPSLSWVIVIVFHDEIISIRSVSMYCWLFVWFVVCLFMLKLVARLVRPAVENVLFS